MLTKTPPVKKLLKRHYLMKTKWGKHLMEAEAHGRFMQIDVSSAQDFLTCPTSHTKIPIDRHEDGRPKDEAIANLAGAFAREVAKNDILAAAKIYVEIEIAASIKFQ